LGAIEKRSDEYEFTKKMTLERLRVFRERLITRSGDGYFENRFIVINDRHVNLRFANIDRFAVQTKQGVTSGQVLDQASPVHHHPSPTLPIEGREFMSRC